MSSSTEQARIATIAGKTFTQAQSMSGADLMQAALVTRAATTVGPGKDGARLAQLAGGSQV